MRVKTGKWITIASVFLLLCLLFWGVKMEFFGTAVEKLGEVLSSATTRITLTIRPRLRSADLNGDGRIDLTDFSILLFNWGVPKNPVVDLNEDRVVDLVDFSIMLHRWTG